ncbi:MAG: MBL fold metallo-hydrolase [Planctomycetota bacterium]
MEFILLGSGSSGNCTLLRAGQDGDSVVVALDCGLALRTARDLARDAGLELGNLAGVLLTHHHADHSANVLPLAARAGCPLHAHPQALEARPSLGSRERNRRGVALAPYWEDAPFQIGPLRCTPVRLPHDAEPTCGFLFEADGQRAGFFTDLGRPDPLTPDLLDGLDFLVLEFNHDREMLQGGPYPPELKQRVAGAEGHLSNEQAAAVLAEAAPRSLRSLVLAHLSRKNNTPELALAQARAGLKARGLGSVRVRPALPRGVVRLGV